MQSQPMSGQRLMRVPCWAATHPLDKFTLQTLLLPVEVAVIVQISATQQQAIMGLKKLLRLGRRRGKDDNASSSARTSSDGTATSSIPIPKPLDKSAAPHPTLEEPTEPAATLPRAENSISLRLWNQAYETIRERNRELVEAYEGVLNEQAVFPGLSGATIALGGLTGTTKEQARFGRLLASARQSIAKSTKHEDAKGAAVDAVTFLKAIDGLVGPIAATFPPAAMAWAGICAVLPVLVQPLIADREMVEGLNYIISRMEWYMKLSEVILEDTWDSNAAIVQLRDTLQGSIIEMYGALLEYEMMSVAYCFKDGPFIRPIKTILGFHNWEERTEAIKQLEGEFYRSNLQYDNREIVQQLRDQRRGQLQREKAERRRVQSKITGRFKTTSYEERMRLNPERIPGTCEWFQGHEKFKEWLKQPRGLLLVSADPGCGKSVLSRHLVENILPAEHPEATICYYFFKDTPEQRGLDSAFCALLHRLFYDHGEIADDCEGDIDAEGGNLLTNATSLGSIFKKATNHPKAGQVICVLDALDECDPDKLQILVKLLHRIVNQTDGTSHVKLLLTTRGYPSILDLFLDFEVGYVHLSGDSRKEKDQIQQEIGLVIDDRLAKLAKRRNLPKERQRRIRKALEDVDHEQRTYLWVNLVFQVLEKNFDDRTQTWTSIIRDTPSTVFQAYEKLLQRVQARDISKVAVVFDLLLATYRPLTLEEMNIAVHIRDREQGIYSEHDMELASSHSFCSWLIETCGFFVTEYDQRVFFIHQTAKEFLLAQGFQPTCSTTGISPKQWQGSTTISSAHQTMSESCIAYLSMDRFMGYLDLPLEFRWFLINYGARSFVGEESSSRAGGEGDVEAHEEAFTDAGRLSSLSSVSSHASGHRSTGELVFQAGEFVTYSLSNWAYHIKEAANGHPERPIHPHFQAWYLSLLSHSPPIRGPVVAATLFYMSVKKDEPLVSYEIFPRPNSTSRDGSEAVTRASIATLLGHRFFLRILLESEIDAMLEEEDHVEPPTVEACESDYDELAVIVPKRGPGQALLFAAERMDLESMELILSVRPSLCLSVRDAVWRTPLHLVAERAVEAACYRNRTSYPNHLKLVVGMGFDIHATSGIGWTVLDHYLHKLGWILDYIRYNLRDRKAILNDMKFLISNGVACKRQEDHRLKPFDVAVILEPRPSLRCLPEEDFGPTFDFSTLKDSKELKDAFRESSIKFMLDHGYDVSDGRALRVAVRHGSLSSVLFLLIAGADINQGTSLGTPLEIAIHKELFRRESPSNQTIIRALLDCGADINAMTNEFGDESLCYPLLHEVIRAYSRRQEYGWPPNPESTLDLLLEKGADVNAADSDGNGALHIACQIDVPERKLAASVSSPLTSLVTVDGADSAAGSTRQRLVQSLVEHGAAIDARNHKGETPLLMACKHHHCCEQVVRFLLEQGADVHARNNEGQSSVDVLQNTHGCQCHREPVEFRVGVSEEGTEITEQDEIGEEYEVGDEEWKCFIEAGKKAMLEVLQEYLDRDGHTEP